VDVLVNAKNRAREIRTKMATEMVLSYFFYLQKKYPGLVEKLHLEIKQATSDPDENALFSKLTGETVTVDQLWQQALDDPSMDQLIQDLNAIPNMIQVSAPAAPVINSVKAISATSTSVQFSQLATVGVNSNQCTATASAAGQKSVTASRKVSPITLTNLQKGTRYSFSVTCKNEVGTSAPSAPFTLRK